MSELAIYYSYSGNTKMYVTQSYSEVYEIKDVKKPGKFKTFLVGCPKAMGHKTLPVEPINIDFSKYDKFIICAPIWAGHPAPQINNVFDVLPKGAEIELHMISGGGESSKDSVSQWVESKGFKITKYVDIKGAL